MRFRHNLATKLSVFINFLRILQANLINVVLDILDNRFHDRYFRCAVINIEFGAYVLLALAVIAAPRRSDCLLNYTQHDILRKRFLFGDRTHC